MIPLSLDQLKIAAADYMYSLVISTDKSEDYAKQFLMMELGKRRIAHKDARLMASIYSEVFVEKMSKVKGNLDDEKKQAMVLECLNETTKRFKEENDG